MLNHFLHMASLRALLLLLCSAPTLVSAQQSSQLAPAKQPDAIVLTQAADAAARPIPAQARAAGTTAEAVPRTEAERQLLSTYKLRAGDVISLRVFGEEDFTRDKTRLNDAGSVSLPFLGEVPVLGKTVSEVQDIVTSGLKGKYLVNPRVTIWIEEYRPFFVNGMVERPGGYPFQPGLNVRKAVSLAGGFKERASLNKIFVIREGDPSQNPQKVDVNTIVGPGDSITVEESFF